LTSRSLVIAVSALALLAVAGIAAIAVSFLGGSEVQSEKSVAAVSPEATLAPATVMPTLAPETPRPPTPTTIGAGPKPTYVPTEPTPTATPTTEPEPTEEPGTGSSEPPGSALPDLVVLNLTVSGDRVSAVIGNVGEQAIPAGATVELALDGALASSSTLQQSLAAGANFTLLLAQEFIYGPISATAVVDPANFIPEANEANNGLTRQLGPDIPLDLALTGLAAVAGDEHLSVSVHNNSSVSARQVTARLTIYRLDSSSPLSITMHQLNIEPQGTTTLAPGLAAVRGLSLRAVLELIGITDGNPSNNAVESLIP